MQSGETQCVAGTVVNDVYIMLLRLSVLQSKSTPVGAVGSLAAGGKETSKKDLAIMMMDAYGQVRHTPCKCVFHTMMTDPGYLVQCSHSSWRELLW